MFLFTYPHISKEKDMIPLTGLTPSCFCLPIHISGRRRMGIHISGRRRMGSTYQEGEGSDTIDRFNPLMFLFTYPHIRKEKDWIPLTGLTPSCFCLPIHISGRRRMRYH
jgi:dihydroorotase